MRTLLRWVNRLLHLGAQQRRRRARLLARQKRLSSCRTSLQRLGPLKPNLKRYL
jgi:hypothetical protein